MGSRCLPPRRSLNKKPKITHQMAPPISFSLETETFRESSLGMDGFFIATQSGGSDSQRRSVRVIDSKASGDPIVSAPETSAGGTESVDDPKSTDLPSDIATIDFAYPTPTARSQAKTENVRLRRTVSKNESEKILLVSAIAVAAVRWKHKTDVVLVFS